jgi:hypothetical protein
MRSSRDPAVVDAPPAISAIAPAIAGGTAGLRQRCALGPQQPDAPAEFARAWPKRFVDREPLLCSACGSSARVASATRSSPSTARVECPSRRGQRIPSVAAHRRAQRDRALRGAAPASDPRTPSTRRRCDGPGHTDACSTSLTSDTLEHGGSDERDGSPARPPRAAATSWCRLLSSRLALRNGRAPEYHGCGGGPFRSSPARR